MLNWQFNQEIEQQLAKLIEEIPPGTPRNNAMSLIRRLRAASIVTEMKGERSVRQPARHFSLMIDDPSGAVITVSGSQRAVEQYFDMLCDSLDCLDASPLTPEAA